MNASRLQEIAEDEDTVWLEYFETDAARVFDTPADGNDSQDFYADDSAT